jgi:hypothetical protein
MAVEVINGQGTSDKLVVNPDGSIDTRLMGISGTTQTQVQVTTDGKLVLSYG